MGLYPLLVNGYNQFVANFPPTLQWLITLVLLVAVVVAFMQLARISFWFLLILVLLLPVLIPLLVSVIMAIWHFFLFLLVRVGIGT
jgi:hypothetical protein